MSHQDQDQAQAGNSWLSKIVVQAVCRSAPSSLKKAQELGALVICSLAGHLAAEMFLKSYSIRLTESI